MKHIAFALLMLTCSAFGQDWTVARCRKTFEDRHKQLAAHLEGMTNSRTDQFKSSVEMTLTRTLIRWQQEVEICTKTDGERPLYGSVSRQLNEVLDERFSAYVREERRGMLSFSEWEREKRREQRHANILSVISVPSWDLP